ncbi:MAG: molybdopterin-dependent oxidoreductase [Candidatus Magnetominusculus sp. LBB02]|nr:molybdopterin-dependent oxidoreductase [Candidatus Magnetominusculus sp. LBB02]
MIELTIDDIKVQVEKGQTILQAALANNIYIPHMCWDPRLKPYGGCRMCLVEIEGQPRPLASCSYPADNGMIVKTNTPRVAKLRKTMVELLLIHHPLDCPTCDKAGQCGLQDLSHHHGPSESRIQEEKTVAARHSQNPFIERNPNRCILCGKCVSICWGHQGVGAINFIGRGFNTKISPAFEEVLDCEFCGQCVDVCPVGALGNKPFKHSCSTWFMESSDSICPYCSVGCTVTLDTREGKIVRTRGIASKGVNKGDLCVKGRYGTDFIYAENRLTKPLIRKDGQLVETTWENAMHVLTERLNEVIKTKGPDRIGVIGSHKFSNESNFMLQEFARKVIGTKNIDSLSHFGFSKVQKAISQTFGLTNLPIKLDSPIGKGAVLVVESDITSTHPVWGLRFLEAGRKGAKVIVLGPRETKLSKHSNIWLRVRPGTSVALLNGIMHIAIESGYHLKNSLSTAAANFSGLEELVKAYTPDIVAKTADIDTDEFVEMAKAFLSAETRMVAMTLGSAENNKGLNTALSAANLLMLTGDGPSALQMPGSYNNTFGMWKMGITPDYLPGYKKVEGKPGKKLYQMLYEENAIDALYIMGDDPLSTYPELKKVESALHNLELLIVQDIRLSDTARLAHIVLPEASWAEKDGSFTNAAGITQTTEKISAPIGDCVAGWQIFRNLTRYMNKIPVVESFTLLGDLLSDMPVNTGQEKWQYAPVHYEEVEPTDGQYQFTMVTGNLMQHSGGLSVMSKILTEAFPRTFVQMNDKDAARLKITNGSMVRVESRRGATTVEVEVSDEVIEGMIFAPINFATLRLNELTYAYEGGGAPLTAVRVRPGARK